MINYSIYYYLNLFKTSFKNCYNLNINIRISIIIIIY